MRRQTLSGNVLIGRVLIGRVLRIVATAVAACGLTADATVAADVSSGEPAAIAVPGTEHWSLRSDQMPAAAPMTPRAKVVPISQMPDERRSVRMVYFGYGEASLIKADR